MAFSTTFGAGAIVGSGATSVWKYSDCFRVIANNGSTVKLTDILSPLDKKSTLKYSLSKIADVYKTLGGESVPVAERSSNCTGQTLFVELTSILTKPNPAVANAIIQVPVQARLELRVPNDGDLSDTDLETLVYLVVAALSDHAGDPKMISELLRGALVPAGI